jgi:hypothetical protein
MEQAYWLGRTRASLAMAQGAASATSRLIHYQLAGFYSVKAARSVLPDRQESSRSGMQAPPTPGHEPARADASSIAAAAEPPAGWLAVTRLSE